MIDRLLERLADGPLRQPLALFFALVEWRNPIRLLRVLCLTAFCLPAIWSIDSWALRVNHALMIWFHEAGHAVFGVFNDNFPYGRALGAFGGSLCQILVAVMFTFVVWASHKRYDASLMFLWIGMNFLDVGYYCADALNRNMPLIFGMDKSNHDWGNIIEWLHLRWAHPVITAGWWLGGMACFAIAVVGCFYYANEES